MTVVPSVLLGLAAVATYRIGKPKLEVAQPQPQSR
jgi:hypothetical protein